MTVQMDLFDQNEPSAPASPSLPHLRILASAGSGKTWQLTRRYLKLLFAGVPVSSILASTFTRLAAGEIRNRIIMALVAAARSEKGLADLRTQLGEPSLSRDTVLQHVTLLAGDMHQMQVRTLDGFFASIVKGFAMELGLSSGAGIVDEAREIDLRQQSVEHLVRGADAERYVRRLAALSRGVPGRSVHYLIGMNVGDLYEIYRQSIDGAWANPPLIDGMLSSEALAAAIDELAATDAGGDKRTRISHLKSIELARRGQWFDFLKSGLPLKIAAGDFTYVSKRLPDDLVVAYQAVIPHARAALIAIIRAQTIATAELLGEFHEAYERVKRDEQAITFSDLVMHLRDVTNDDRLSDIYYRIDGTIDHLLLDEFQDTSVVQWQALAPIARELVSDASSGRTFFCVGDVKQSIYGWRDAAPEVLGRLGDLLYPTGGGALEDEHLELSYRSSPVIMDTVNRVFSTIAENPALDDYAAGAVSWSATFATHDTVKRPLPGFAALVTVEKPPRRSAAVPRLRAAARHIAALHGSAPHMTIGVLTRTNDAATRLLFELGRLDVEASSRGAGLLTDSPAVNLILDLLRLADHPGDTVSAFNVANSALGGGEELHVNPTSRYRLAKRTRRGLLADGYATSIAAWAATLAPTCNERDVRRLSQLVELAESFDLRETTCRPDAFVRRAEVTRVTDFRAAPIQVMTIHKSKGLEFDAVVLPDLESRLVHGSPTVVTRRDEIAGAITQVSRWVSSDLGDAIPQPVASMIAEHRAAEIREALCLLYVAITRARQGLLMIIDPPSPKKPRSSMASILAAALAPDRDDAATMIWSHGDPRWVESVKAKPSPPPPSTTPTEIRLAPAGPRRASRAAPPPSAPPGTYLRTRLSLSRPEGRDYGTVTHALLERVAWLEDFVDDDDTLLAAARAVLPPSSPLDPETVVQRFRNTLATPAIAELLTRGDRDIEVWCERPFALMTDAGVQKGFMDRLTVERVGGERRVDVIDYKTDDVVLAGVAEKAAEYGPQMASYRAAAASQLGVPEGSVRAMLVFVGPGVVVEQ